MNDKTATAESVARCTTTTVASSRRVRREVGRDYFGVAAESDHSNQQGIRRGERNNVVATCLGPGTPLPPSRIFCLQCLGRSRSARTCLLRTTGATLCRSCRPRYRAMDAPASPSLGHVEDGGHAIYWEVFHGCEGQERTPLKPRKSKKRRIFWRNFETTGNFGIIEWMGVRCQEIRTQQGSLNLRQGQGGDVLGGLASEKRSDTAES